MTNDQANGNPVRVLLIDEFVLFRASLGRYLASEPGLIVAGECGTSREALTMLRSSNVDVILFDSDADVEPSGHFIPAARQAGYEGRFLVLAGNPDVRRLALALKLGATGVFLKSEALDRLLHAIQLVAQGEVWIDQKIIRLIAEQLFFPHGGSDGKEGLAPLGERERNVLEGIVRGLSNRKIGEGMGLSESSVKNIVQRLFGIAGVNTRSQLVRAAMEGSLDSRESVSRRSKDNQKPVQLLPEGSRQLAEVNLLAQRRSED
jgi:two-component system, NarL family, nitrate/nitrite response regulator NarL